MRVSHFFRASTSSLEQQFKKNNHNRQSKPSSPTHSYASPLADDSDDPHADKMAPADSREDNHHHHHHRLSFPGFHLGRTASKDKDANPHTANHAAKLSLFIESGPIVFLGSPEESTGALVSGQVFLDVKADSLTMESFSAALNIHVTQKKPFAQHCSDCANQYTEIKRWSFPLPESGTLAKGVHQWPFSVLLDGQLPASLDGPLVSIAYEFKAEAVPAATHGHGHGHHHHHSVLKLEKILPVKRSLPVPEVPHHSVRVFPPTNIKASAHFPHVVHAIGANTFSMRLDGIAKLNEKNATIEYWKLKKLSWRLEETAKTVAPACEKHTPKDVTTTTAEGGVATTAKKGTPRTDTRIVGERTFFSGWKSDYCSNESACVEAEFEWGPRPDANGRRRRYACDGASADGTETTHQLVVEMVVGQEWAPVARRSQATQTGVGRVLRMHFNVVMTETGGLGISWDNESPPLYDNVPPSPPAYGGGSSVALEDVGAAAMLDGVSPPASPPPPAWTPQEAEAEQR